MLSPILIVLVRKLQKYSTDGELRFILNVKQAISLPVLNGRNRYLLYVKQLRWGIIHTDSRVALLFQHIFMSVLCNEIVRTGATHIFADAS